MADGAAEAQGVRIFRGHVLDTLPTLPEAFAQTCVTSPPYWGLRDYGTTPVDWPEVTYSPMPGLAPCTIPAQQASLGLEVDPNAYVAHLVAVFREVARTLRPDGTLWLNLGDSYAGSRRGPQGKRGVRQGRASTCNFGAATEAVGYAAKALIPQPWLVAFALQADGWILRSWIPWVKRNPMPGSQRDRPTASCETVFLFGHPQSKGRYAYDHEAVKVIATGKPQRRNKPHKKRIAVSGAAVGHPPHRFDGAEQRDTPRPDTKDGKRTWRTSDAFFGSLRAILAGGQGMLANDDGDPLALVVNTKGYKGAHFAVFPPHLVEPCIKAGAPERGCCAHCGTPWQRVVVKGAPAADWREHDTPRELRGKNSVRSEGQLSEVGRFARATRTTGWKPGCACPDADTVPCVVLDPFGGAGSTGVAAEKLGRLAVLCELSDDYADQAEARVSR